MAMQEWATEANRLLDAWAEAQAEIRGMHEHARIYREKLSEANNRLNAARGAFDTFMHSCMMVRCDVLQPAADPDLRTPAEFAQGDVSA